MNRILLILLLLSSVNVMYAQESSESPSPRGAFFRSLAVPGWGHYYVDYNNWARGQYHMGAEVALLVSYFGLNIHSNNLQQNWQTYTINEAGIDISNRSRMLQLAVGNFNSLSAYNDFQLRSRNFDQLIDDTPQNRWQWATDTDRNAYNNIRSRFESIDQQLPALIGLMVVNRLISGISAYNRARKLEQGKGFTSVSVLPFNSGKGIMARLHIDL